MTGVTTNYDKIWAIPFWPSRSGCPLLLGQKSCRMKVPRMSLSASGGGTEGGAILLHFCGSPDPFFWCSKMSLFYLKTCNPMKGTPWSTAWEFFEFSSRILPRISLGIWPRVFWGVFVLRFVGIGDQIKLTNNPRHFSMQKFQANSKKKFTKVFWRAGKATVLGPLTLAPQKTHA